MPDKPLPTAGKTTVWVLGDQLNPNFAHLRGRDPATTCVLMVISAKKLTERHWHTQKLHLVITAMRRFGDELAAAKVSPSTSARQTVWQPGIAPTSTRTVRHASSRWNRPVSPAPTR
jgi:hypothetical protein